MLDALAGKQYELLKEREMENAYLKALKRPENLVFIRDQGASWDLFTVGTYRDLKHFGKAPVFLKHTRKQRQKQRGAKPLTALVDISAP